MKHYLSLFLLFALLSNLAEASHNRAGNILFRKKDTGKYVYEITLITYTKLTSYDADRPEAKIAFGDGTIGIAQRIVEDSSLGNNTKLNVYVFEHQYPGLGTYIIAYNDPNRNGGIKNMDNSDLTSFYLQSLLIIHPFLGANNSPILYNPPIDNATVDQLFVHNPGAFDTEGDSLSYKMTLPMQVFGNDTVPVANYKSPASFNLGKTSTLTLDSLNGNLLWDVPRDTGEYNVAFIIEEWRGNFLIGYVVRDLQIRVFGFPNKPPVIHPNADSTLTTFVDTCITAGDFMSYPVSATDPDKDELTLSALSGPFVLQNSPASFTTVTDVGKAVSLFTWQTNCNHVREQPYQILFKARDNPPNNPPPPKDTLSLTDLETWNIRVVGPAPKNLQAAVNQNSADLKWDTYTCDNAVGFSVWRRKGAYGIPPDNCELGAPPKTGYVKIATVTSISITSFTDDNNGNGLARGNIYCYVVVAIFNDGSGVSESYRSNEACIELEKVNPILTNVSVEKTSLTNGKINVIWTQPSEFDTIVSPGPYQYRLQKAVGMNDTNFTQIYVYSTPRALSSSNDTTFLDTVDLNTQSFSYRYRIDYWNVTPGDTFRFQNINYEESASSVFLSTVPEANFITLKWRFNVPWQNIMYLIYRGDPQGNFILVDSTTEITYKDDSLVTGQKYCYYINAIGTYGTPGILARLENKSEITCDIPSDSVPPCPPILSVDAQCDEYQNSIMWRNSMEDACESVLAINYYTLYWSAAPGQSMSALDTIKKITKFPPDTFYLHSNLTTSLAGCYAVTATDTSSNKNESKFSNIVCVDNCPFFELPNVFTPNGDGFNDIFTPKKTPRFVTNVKFKVFNRWGVKVFTSTNDMFINWKGVTDGGKNLSDGVYFYLCEYELIHLGGNEKKIQTGWVQLVR
ncbi:MAG: hypothetical protein A3G23_08340 [Bacteroidetes bacterium RIFCSPLOWO2_12_FULL_37_12]|nr:MAG: hypothetical protein A3G23_08340 [Bacteroidetes bacterium RIFCSPLOWO2_12_FULL_37_12]